MCLALSNDIVKHCYLTNFTSRMNSPLLDISYENDSFHYVTTGAESEQPVGVLFLPVGGLQRPCRNLVFLILGVGRLREDQLIYVETRENVFFIIWDL